MSTVRIGVTDRSEFKRRAKAAFRGEYQGEHIGFASLELMHRVLTPNRWDMLKAMMGGGSMGIRELARKLDRDVKSTHVDAAALVNAGVINRTENGSVEFPYDAVHVDFIVKAAGAAPVRTALAPQAVRQNRHSDGQP